MADYLNLGGRKNNSLDFFVSSPKPLEPFKLQPPTPPPMLNFEPILQPAFKFEPRPEPAFKFEPRPEPAFKPLDMFKPVPLHDVPLNILPPSRPVYGDGSEYGGLNNPNDATPGHVGPIYGEPGSLYDATGRNVQPLERLNFEVAKPLELSPTILPAGPTPILECSPTVYGDDLEYGGFNNPNDAALGYIGPIYGEPGSEFDSLGRNVEQVERFSSQLLTPEPMAPPPECMPENPMPMAPPEDMPYDPC